MLIQRPIRVLDPACGSGSFLIGAYQHVPDCYRDWYVNHGAEKWMRRTNSPIYLHGYRGTPVEPKREGERTREPRDVTGPKGGGSRVRSPSRGLPSVKGSVQPPCRTSGSDALPLFPTAAVYRVFCNHSDSVFESQGQLDRIQEHML